MTEEALWHGLERLTPEDLSKTRELTDLYACVP
jgi:hypothetical protein